MAKDRYRTIVKLEDIRSLYEQEEYEQAVEIANSLSEQKIKDASDLFLLAAVYRKVGENKVAKIYLHRIYEKKCSRRVLEELMDVCLAEKNPEEASEYLASYQRIAGNDPRTLIYEYRIGRQLKRPDEELLPVLQQLKEEEYSEKYAYELAKLYHKLGMKDECMEECSDIILWFGDGTYVERARVLQAYYRGELSAADIQAEAERRIREAEERQAREIAERAAEEERRLAEEARLAAEKEAAERAEAERLAAEEAAAKAEDNRWIEPEDPDHDAMMNTFDVVLTKNEETQDIPTAATGRRRTLVEDHVLAKASGLMAQVEGEEVDELAAKFDMLFEPVAVKTEPEETKSEQTEVKAETEASESAENIATDSAEESAKDDSEPMYEEDSSVLTEESESAKERSESETEAAKPVGSEETESYEQFSLFETTEMKEVKPESETEAKAEEPESETEAKAEEKESETETKAEEPENEAEEEIIRAVTEALMSEVSSTDEGEPEPAEVEETKKAEETEEPAAVYEKPEEDASMAMPTGELADRMEARATTMEASLHAYARIPGLRKQLLRSLEVMVASRGKSYCLIIEGAAKSGKTTLGLYLIKMICGLMGIRNPRVARLEAEKLNKIRIEDKLEQLRGSFMIVEHAAQLTEETARKLVKYSDKEGILAAVILEDDVNEIKHFLKRNSDCMSAFINIIRMPQLGKEELMAFAVDEIRSRDYEYGAEVKEILEKRAERIASTVPEGERIVTMIAYTRKALENTDRRVNQSLMSMASKGDFQNAAELVVVEADFSFE